MIRSKKVAKYMELTKPKVTLLNLLVGVTCFILAAYPAVDWLKIIVFSIAGYLAAGGCGVLNSVYDKDIDKLMPRTSKRAIPAGHMPIRKAAFLGIAMLFSGFALSYFFFNLLTVLMIGLGAIFYLLIYTVWLKRVSTWNVVIGGFAGCFAALSGWTAAVNTLSLLPLLVAMLDFLWTPGHLWALAIKRIREYRNARVPMLPVKVGINKASRIVFWSNILTVSFSLLFPLTHLTGMIFTFVLLAAGITFIYLNRRLLILASEDYGFRVFVASMPYLAIIMLGLIVDKILLI